jgi:aldose 1-epimerase
MSGTGSAIEALLISSGKLKATVLTVGAALFDLSIDLPQGIRRLILKHNTPEAYRYNPHYLGVIAGRCANRIRDGHCSIAGTVYHLDRNEHGKTHLHGGELGFSRRLWTVTSRELSAVELTLHSPQGDQGYPGNARISCLYEVLPDCRLRMTLTATSDADTLVNLAGHAYFNLEPGLSVLDHRLTIHASRYTPVDSDLIPDGRLLDVQNTAFDFRVPTFIGERRNLSPVGYDHNFMLAPSPRHEPLPAATLVSPSGDLSMHLLTTEPGLQFYDGSKLSPDTGDSNSALRPFAGCCLEPQRFPDATHWPHFAQSLLRRGEEYRQVTEYVFAQTT